MNDLLLHINDWFQIKQSYFKCFCANDSRVESWFKGELMVLLEKLKTDKIIESYLREYKHPCIDKKRIDFKIDYNGSPHFVELKAPCCTGSAKDGKSF